MMEVFDCIQGSPEWHACRAGVPTASNFAKIMAQSAERKGRADYMLRLAGEIITGKPAETFTNAAMERGREMEAEARDYYAFARDAELQLVGFIKNHGAGASPDALNGDRGLAQFKTAEPHILIPMLLKNDFPNSHKAQCQGELWVLERDWTDLCIYWPGMPPLIVQAGRDEAYIRELAAEVERFNEELAELVEKVRRFGHVARAAA